MLTYLACPYTDISLRIRNERVSLATSVAARLAETGTAVFSPITHGHELAKFLPRDQVSDHSFWMRQCIPFLAASRKLVLLPLKGWRISRGIEEELAYATARGIPVYVWEDPSWPLIEKLTRGQLQALGFERMRN